VYKNVTIKNLKFLLSKLISFLVSISECFG